MPQLSYFWRTALGGLLLLSTRGAGQSHTIGTGLRGQYYDGQQFEKLVLTRTDRGIDFNWTIGPTGDHFVSPGLGVPSEWFSARWKGHLYAPVTGVYTIQMTADDGMRVWVGGQRVLNSWQNQAVSTYEAKITLTAGRYYPIRVDYYQAGKDSRALLAWQLPNTTQEPQPIPAAYLYTHLPTTAVPVVTGKPATQPPHPQTAALSPSLTVTPRRPAVVVRRRLATAATPRPRPASPPPLSTTPSDTVLLPDLSVLSSGAAVTLPNLYFPQSTADLLPASRPVLNKLAQILRQQPTLRLEIAGHTDNVGDAALNRRLSQQRARVVRRYLLQRGIDSLRLTAVGYGGTHPVADNRDPQQRPRNRRLEITIQ